MAVMDSSPPARGVMVSADTTFENFVAARSHRLLRTAYLLTGDHALAEDLLQTALAKAWGAWGRSAARGSTRSRRSCAPAHDWPVAATGR